MRVVGLDGADQDPDRRAQPGRLMVSAERFAAGSAATVVVSRADTFADSLAAAPLTATGPLLYTSTDSIPDATRAELQRVARADATVYLLGGTAAISQTVQDQLAAMGYTVTRLAGARRVETLTATPSSATSTTWPHGF